MSKRQSAFLAVGLFLFAVFVLARWARADTLQAVQAPADYTGWLIALGLMLLVVGAVYAHRRWPSQSAKVDAEAKTALAKAIAALAEKLSDKPIPAPQDAPAPVEAVVIPPAGKKGQAGVISFPVGGADFQADLAAFMAAYNS